MQSFSVDQDVIHLELVNEPGYVREKPLRAKGNNKWEANSKYQRNPQEDKNNSHQPKSKGYIEETLGRILRKLESQQLG